MEIPMTLIQCASCGMPFAITQDFEQRLRQCHNTFYCPHGHQNFFGQQTDQEKKIKALTEQNQRLESELNTANQRETERLKKIRDRKRKQREASKK